MINHSRQRKLTGILLAVMMLLSNVMPVFAEVTTAEPAPLVSASPAPEVVVTATPVPSTPVPVTQVPATPVPATPIPVTKAPVTAEPVTAAPATATPAPAASAAPTESVAVTTQTPAPAGPSLSEPLVTVEPSAAPSPAASATIAPAAPQEPTAEPVVSAAPTQTPSVTAVPSSEPTAEVTDAPAVTEQPVDGQVSLTPQQESLVGVCLSVGNFSMMSLLIAESGIPNLYTVRIAYLDEAGVMVTEPYLAIIEAGKSLSVASPAINGYMTTTSVVDVPAISANFSQTVTYTTTPSTYTVNHLQESLDGASYVKVENETLSGVQGNLTNARAKQYAGFVEYPITQQIIAPENSTVVEVKYWRVTYSINFSTTTEGSAVPSITKKFGAPISSSEISQNPIRKGYTFLGRDWNNDGLYTSADIAPTAMEAQNRTVKAIWQAGMTEYRIIYWAQNANDNNYTPTATLKTQGLTGTVAAADYLSGTAGTTYYYGNATGAGTAPMTAAEFAELQYFITSSKQTNELHLYAKPDSVRQ